MTHIDFAKLFSFSPALYAILACCVYLLKNLLPFMRKSIQLKQADLDCLMEIKSSVQRGEEVNKEILLTLKNLATSIGHMPDKSDLFTLKEYVLKSQYVPARDFAKKEVVKDAVNA